MLDKFPTKLTGGSQDRARNSHALGQDDFSDGVNFDSAEENIGVRLEHLNIHRSSQWVVDTLDGDLVLSVHNFDLVVRHVGTQPVADEVGGLDGGIANNSGHLANAMWIHRYIDRQNVIAYYYLVVLDGHNGLVQDRGQTASSNAFIAHTAAQSFLFLALGLFPLVAQGRRDVFLAASPGGLEKKNKQIIFLNF